MQVSFAKRIAG